MTHSSFPDNYPRPKNIFTGIPSANSCATKCSNQTTGCYSHGSDKYCYCYNVNTDNTCHKLTTTVNIH